MAEIRALLIDDDSRIAELLKTFLGQNGVSVEHAGDGQRGLQKLESAGFDVVLPGGPVEVAALAAFDGAAPVRVVKEQVPEGAEDAVADRLRQAAVQRRSKDATLTQFTGHPIGTQLGTHEDHDAPVTSGQLGGQRLGSGHRPSSVIA